MMEPTGEMSSEQHSAIRHSIEIGKRLIIDHPEIAEWYRDGMSHSGIAESLDVKGKYGASDKVAETSIYYAIKGLIQDLDELTRLEHEHRAEYGRKTATEGKGAHGQSPKTGLTYRSEGGRKAVEEGKGAHGYNPETGVRYVVENGRKTAAEGKGVHGLTPEQRSEYSSKGGRIGGIKAALAKGLIPWEKEETEYAHLLSLEPEFQHQKGSWKGKGDYKTIAQVLNEDYHNGKEVRSQQSVKKNLFKYTKTLGN